MELTWDMNVNRCGRYLSAVRTIRWGYSGEKCEPVKTFVPPTGHISNTTMWVYNHSGSGFCQRSQVDNNEQVYLHCHLITHELI